MPVNAKRSLVGQSGRSEVQVVHRSKRHHKRLKIDSIFLIVFKVDHMLAKFSASIILFHFLLVATHVACFATEPEPAWRSLFDGKSLAGWKKAEFGGDGDAQVNEGKIVLEMGNTLTGITFDGKDLPTDNFEIELEAMRVEGRDFFCGLTFPVKDSHCSLIVGGWAGTVVGLSNIDDEDASENETTKYIDFETGRWYKIRVRVAGDHISAWIDDKQVVDQDIKDRKISIRPEVNLSRPLGLSAWQTKAAIRGIRVREVGK